MAEDVRNSGNEAALRRALALIVEALDLLDAHSGPPEVTGYLDLASQRLREALSA
jgi:hypothetical protein